MLRRLPATSGDALLVGAHADDAAVWRIDDERALVVTVDVITPLVDDARTWGRIAATNAASDVYAMGGRPLFALNIVGWNRDELSLDLLGEVLLGGADAASGGGWMVAGGHTIDDPEPKYGQAVIGEVALDGLLRKDGLRAGDALVLTKPLGIGVAATAIKAGRASHGLESAAVASMVRTNADAAVCAVAAQAAGATDVTGFGLLGHLREMVEAHGGIDADIDAARVPLLPGVADLAAEGVVPGGSRRNLQWVAERLDSDVDDTALLLLADAQTSGGLLFGVEPDAAEGVVGTLRGGGHEAAVVGHVRAGGGRLRVRG